jgi:tetrahydromethanopterin S-methyltransferase subunit B
MSPFSIQNPCLSTGILTCFFFGFTLGATFSS